MKKKTFSRKKPLPKDSLPRHLAKIFLSAVILTGIVIIAGAVAIYLLDRKPADIFLPAPSETKKNSSPVFEIYPDRDAPLSPSGKRPLPPGEKPKIAIIIDDLGYDLHIAQKFLSCRIPLTFSILPHGPFSKKVACAAYGCGIEVMLHLPMEPVEYPVVDPGPGVLLTTMSPDALLRQLETNLADFPHITGVNNHMGSRMTAVSTQLYQIFTVLKKHGCFFIDSRTTTNTLCRPSARLFQVPFAERDVFLDNSLEPDYIAHQLEELVRIARRQGRAVGIGHPHAVTCRVLQEKLSAMKKVVDFVPASEMVFIVRS